MAGCNDDGGRETKEKRGGGGGRQGETERVKQANIPLIHKKDVRQEHGHNHSTKTHSHIHSLLDFFLYCKSRCIL